MRTDLTPDPLPADAESLRGLVGRLRTKYNELEVENLRLKQQLEWFRKRYYGPRTDQLQTEAELGQMLLAFSEELDSRPVNPEDVAPPAPPLQEIRSVRRRPGRRNLARLDHLPVRLVVHELSPEERACRQCGVERREIGAEEKWQLEYVPGYFERIQHLRKKYACPHCEVQGEGPQITTAGAPVSPIEKGMAGPGLLAYIVTSKFSDYLPLYRIENIFERIGCEVSRATMSVWCGDVADLIEPLYALMADRVRQSEVIGTDDTPMPMLDPGAGKTRTARMWIYTGDRGQPYNVFDFTESRKRDGPLRFLKDYRRTLVADAYGGYDGVVAGNQILRAGCWAHCRRKFVDAEKVAPEIAREAVALIRLLYKVETQAAQLNPAARLELRRQESVPVLDQLHRRLLDWKQELLPKHPMAEAVGYALNQWVELNVFARDGAVPIDNNQSEREIKRQVLNRKSSLFVGNPRGGRTAAILSSLTSTCRRHEINPQLYFTQLLVNLPAWPVRDLAAWLPDRWKLTQSGLSQAGS